MASYLLWTLCLAVAISSVYSGPNEACKERECPNYKVVKAVDGLEFRLYEAQKFASTEMERGNSYLTFYKLYTRNQEYFNGANDQKQKIPLTYPISKSLRKTADGEKFGMDFYIPKKFHDNTPIPTNDKVTIYSGAGALLAARSFSGFSTLENVMKQKAIIEKQLHEMDIPFYDEIFYALSYNGAGQLSNRYNEVMYTVYDL